MEEEFRRFLLDFYADFLVRQTLAILYRDHGVQTRFTDETLTQYRSEQEQKRLEKELQTHAERLARELVHDLESRGFNSPEDLEARKSELKIVVDKYHKRLIQRLR